MDRLEKFEQALATILKEYEVQKWVNNLQKTIW